MDWSAGATKTLVVLGDAAPHPPAQVHAFPLSFFLSFLFIISAGTLSNEILQDQEPPKNGLEGRS